MKKYTTIILYFFISDFLIFSQSDPSSKFLKPSVEAQSLQGINGASAELFTGKVNINIPLYTLKQYDIEVPISLTYQGGGIKVTDEGNQVGLGWTLNVGGVISRNVCGAPDELYDQTYKVVGFNNLEKPIYSHISGYDDRRSFVDLIKRRIMDYNPTDQYRFSENYSKIGYMSNVFGMQYDDGHFDSAQDTYSFNIMGISGAFVIDKSNNCIIQSNDGVQILYNKLLNTFEVREANGYIYKFEERETSTYSYKVGYGWYCGELENFNYQQFNYTSSWWLSSIISPSGENINFNYQHRNYTCTDYNKDYSECTTFYPKEFWREYIDEDFLGSSECFCESVYIDSIGLIQVCSKCKKYYEPIVHNIIKNQPIIYQKETYEKICLSSIETSNSEIFFDYTWFLCNTPTLKQIKILPNKLQSNIVQKKIDFNYSYFIPFDNKYSRKKLDNIKIYNDNTTIDPLTYKFSYIEKDDNNENIIFSYNSKQRDHWGYGAFDGGLIPSPITSFGKYNYSGSGDEAIIDRSADPQGSVSCMLKSITYPTGGRTELTWEPNTFSKLGLLSERSLGIISDDSFFKSLTQAMDKIDHNIYIKASGENKNLQGTFFVPVLQNINIDLSQYYSNYFPKNDPLWGDCIYGWNLSDTVDIAGLKLPYLQFTSSEGKIYFVRINKQNIENITGIYTLPLPSGLYKYKLCNPRSELGQQHNECSEFYYRCQDGIDASYGTIKINYFTLRSSGIPLNSYYVGGCRIKKILNISNNDSIARLYDYSLDGTNPNSSSSGVLTNIPRYSSLFTKDYWKLKENGEPLYLNEEAESYLLTLNSDGLSNSVNGGSHIEYSKVRERIIKNNHPDPLDPERRDIRQTTYNFWTSLDSYCQDEDMTNYATIMPSNMVMLTSRNYKRGHLKGIEEITDERKTTTFNYQILDNENTDTITGSLFTVGDYTELPFLNNTSQYGLVRAYKDFGIVKYKVIPYNKRLKEVITTGSIADDYKKYTYVNSEYSSSLWANSPLSETIKDSEGDEITKYYTYTYKNKIHTCVTVKNGKIIDAFRNEYNDKSQIAAEYIAELNSNQLPDALIYNLGTSQFISISHPIFSLTNKLIKTFTYDRNRLAQVTDNRYNSSITYLWSYNGEYPIAEIKNTQLIDVRNLLGDNIIGSLFSSLEPDMSIVDNLRQSMPQCVITTMTYKLLKGINSFTDPRGVKTTFEYDESGNLKNIKDYQNRLLQTINYHYIGEYL